MNPLEKMKRRERAVVLGNRTPLAAQRFVDSLPYNFEERGDTMRSFRSALRMGRAHCLEAVFIAAAILEQHDYPPLLMDIESADGLDHVVLLFRDKGRWGCVARSRDPALHGRKPVFPSIEALVRSYVLPYIDLHARILAYGVLDLRDLPGVGWRFSTRNVWAVERALIGNRHTPVRTSDREYQIWRDKYRRFHGRWPDKKPMYFPNQHHWLSVGPKAKR